MGASFFSNPTDYEVVDEGGDGSGFYDGPAYTAIDPVAINDSVAEAAASAAASEASKVASGVSATASAASASASAVSAAAALVSQNAAAASATAADASDDSAVAQAAIATTKASEAATSAAAALVSEGNADTSETNAASSASAAATSASNASTSETNAAASAAAALVSETNAAAAVQAAKGTATPLMDGAADVGTGVKWAKEDHVHPTDTSRADAAATTAALALKASLASPALTGTPTAPTATVGTNTTQLATTAFVLANSSSGNTIYASVAEVEAATISASVDRLETAGYTTAGDGGGSIATGATYERVGSEPSHEGKIQSADGAWWELTGDVVNIKQFGAVPSTSDIDTDPDASAAINDAIAYCNLNETSNLVIPWGLYPLDAALTPFTFVIRVQGAQGAPKQSTLYKRYTEADAYRGILSIGNYGGEFIDLQFAAKSGVSGGSAFSAILTWNAPNGGVLRLRNIYSSCGDSINQNLTISGATNTGGGDGLGGKSYRSVFLENCHFFGAANYGIILSSVQHCFASNVFMATDGGTNSSGLLLYCHGSSAAPSDDIYWHGIIAGNLSLDYLTRSNFNCVVTGTVTNTSNVTTTTILDARSTRDQNWTDSGVMSSGAWPVTTPTPTSETGTLTSASSSIAYTKIGKLVHCHGEITVTTAGTGGGSLNVQLPFTLKRRLTFAGKESAVNGLAFVAFVATTGLMGLRKYENSTIIVTGGLYPFSFTAELA